MNWWREHVDHTVKYTKAAEAKNRPGMLQAVSNLTKGAIEWGRVSGRSSLGTGLMAEHVIGAKLAVDSAFSGNTSGVECASALLGRNAELQSMIYGATWNLPWRAFHALFVEHIEYTKRYILALAKHDLTTFDFALASARKNAYDLDKFTQRSFRR